MRTRTHYDHSLQLQRRERLRQLMLYHLGDRVGSFFWDDGPNLYGFENREGQTDMAFEILEAMRKRQHLVVEAGVGIGKSFAYLVPLLLYNSLVQKPVIIATSTIALQEQLLKDVTTLQNLLDIAPSSQDVILAKGQRHYLCRKRCLKYISDKQAPMREELLEAIQTSDCGERKEFPFHIPQPIWDQICISKFGRKCCEGCCEDCKYEEIRSDLLFTNGIVICNQDFLTAHLMNYDHRKKRGLINSSAEFLVIDEAHNLEDKVRSATTSRISQSMILGAIEAAIKPLDKASQALIREEEQSARSAVKSFYNRLKKQIEQQIEESEQDLKYADRFFFKQDKRSLEMLNDMAQRLGQLRRSVDIYSSFQNRRDDSYSSTDELSLLSSKLMQSVLCIDNQLLWLEKDGKRVSFVFCPKDTSDIVSELYFGNDVCTILASATLTTAGHGDIKSQYEYFTRNIGFPTDTGALSVPKPSPFPYDAHAMIYYCDDLPHPTKEHDAFIKEGSERLIDILKISHGKALVLFTAKTDMEEVYEQLCAQKLPYKVLMQGQGSSQESVLKQFKEDTDSVLLGTGAYWEGIDIQGSSLSNLVIFRLPFPVPDPIIEYKASVAKDQLMEVRVPEMIIKLKQGIGRLIRSEKDTGIVSIIDPRLRDKPATRYRNMTWAALPIHNRTTSLEELASFYNNLSDQTIYPTPTYAHSKLAEL